MSRAARAGVAAVGVITALAVMTPSGAAGAERAPARAADAYAPRVQVMVVGRTRLLRPASFVYARSVSLLAAGRRCAVAGGTPLAALEALRRLRGPGYGLRDFGACSSNPADASSLFVTRIAADVNRGRDGWVYKVGRRAGTTGAGEARGPFGTGARLRAGQRLTWFYCHMGLRGCQATLELSIGSRLGAGATAVASVRGYDDAGRGRAIAGALIRLAGAQGVTGPDGRATVATPPRAGRYLATATASGAVGAFPVGVTIG